MNRNRLIPILIALLLLLLLNQAALAAGDWVCPQCGKRVREIVGDICPYCGYERHMHDWAPATCVRPKTCKTCGETEGGPDPANHTGETEVRNQREAACEEAGYTGDTCCAACGQVLAQGREIPAAGHRWDAGRVIHSATCQVEGVIRHTCAVCGETRTDILPTDPDGHLWDDGSVLIPATCTEEGIARYTCTACGATETRVLPLDPAHHAGGQEVRNAKEASCEDEGYTGDTYCSACGVKLEDGKTVPAAGHKWQWATMKAPKTCRVCGKTEGEPLRVITFGHYEQDNNKANGPEAIEWLILEVDEASEKALLISRYGLDVQPYHHPLLLLVFRITWKDCTLRRWLNKEFLETAFSKTEQGAILVTAVDNSRNQGYSDWDTYGGENTEDRIFLLSYAEANKYFGVQHYRVNGADNNMQSRITPTVYAKAQGAIMSDGYKTMDGEAAGWWWLRSPGVAQGDAAGVLSTGSLTCYYVSDGGNCVRPALWIDLESGIF